MKEPSKAAKMLQDALAAVKDRHSIYGPPDEHFARTIRLFNAHFAHKLKEPLTIEDWPQVMILEKLARFLGPGNHADNIVDIAGYAACLSEVSE